MSSSTSASSSTSSSPRTRLSLYAHRTLSHDIAAALKASPPPLSLRTDAATLNFEPTPAPPPSPVDFDYSPSDSFGNSASSSSTSVHDDWQRAAGNVSVGA